VRLRGKYLKLEITPAEEAALAEAQKLGARLLATLPAGSITTAPGFHVTGTVGVVVRCVRCVRCVRYVRCSSQLCTFVE
jgi:predicted nucleic acid-binding protein